MQAAPARSARWRPAAAQTIRGALAAMGAVARDAVLRGAAPMRMDTALLTDTAGVPLAHFGLDRAAQIVEGLRSWIGSPSAPYVRELLRALLLARMAARFPDGPAPQNVLEPLVRSQRPLHEQEKRTGAVLSPLAATRDELLAWDIQRRRILRVSHASHACETTLLARGMYVDAGHPTPRATLTRVTQGPPAASNDRRMLRHAISDFRTVGLAYAAELGDPFPRDAAPMLVGPFRFVRRTSEGGLWALVEDARGDRVSLRFSGKRLERIARATLHALVRPVARQGLLVLIAHVIWVDGRREPGHAAPIGCLPWDEGIVHDLGEKLLRLVTNGLDANYSVAAEVRRMAPHLAAAGYPRLARMAHEVFAPGAPPDPVKFAAAAHLTHAVLSGPRRVELAEAA